MLFIYGSLPILQYSISRQKSAFNFPSLDCGDHYSLRMNHHTLRTESAPERFPARCWWVRLLPK